MESKRSFVNVVSRNHVEHGIAGGFMQADHGDDRRLRRLSKGDRIVFYSPRAEIRAGESVQSFTAIGEVIDDAPYQVDGAWRRAMRFSGAAAASVRPLIESLDFIANKKSWGVTFRRGFFQIGEKDFSTIENAMTS